MRPMRLTRWQLRLTVLTTFFYYAAGVDAVSTVLLTPFTVAPTTLVNETQHRS
ncbi:hypothetical protein [Methylomonas sp. AM2-LC]|uniref:hypothetical protein n=1 Tax=Methylomonas sp. AM2-LC TaxID=3153301 RepID=UPI003263162E